MKSVGIIGFGQFGAFAAGHLSPHVTVTAYDSSVTEGSYLRTIEKVVASDYVIFAVPVQHLEEACQLVKPYLRPDTLIADVSSVKVKPLEILTRHFPNHRILGTHPIFGPQSGKNGIAGLPIVLCNVTWTSEEYEAIRSFLSETLQLTVIEKSPDEHDHEMAHVQGLSHFIGRALSELDIQEYQTSTRSYHHLVELTQLLKGDSWELFATIQNENPYAAEVRSRVLSTLESLQERLSEEVVK